MINVCNSFLLTIRRKIKQTTELAGVYIQKRSALRFNEIRESQEKQGLKQSRPHSITCKTIKRICKNIRVIQTVKVKIISNPLHKEKNYKLYNKNASICTIS